jgi:hypothetical protein
VRKAPAPAGLSHLSNRDLGDVFTTGDGRKLRIVDMLQLPEPGGGRRAGAPSEPTQLRLTSRSAALDGRGAALLSRYGTDELSSTTL